MASLICEVLATVGDLDKGELTWYSQCCFLGVLTLFSPSSPEWWAAGKTALTACTPPLELGTRLHRTTLPSRPGCGFAQLCTTGRAPSLPNLHHSNNNMPIQEGAESQSGEIHPSFIDTAAGSKSNKENAKFCTQIIFYTKVCRLNVSLLSFWESM